MTSDFFKKMNSELEEIWNNYNPNYYNNIDECSEAFEHWKKKVLPKLSVSYKTKLKRLNWDGESYLLSQNILRDMYFKYMKKSNSKKNMELMKLLQAREKNIDFEIDLIEVFRPSYNYNGFPKSIEALFYDLGYDYSTTDVESLEKLSIIEIHNVITDGLFRKKYYKDYCKSNGCDYKELMKDTTKDFENFIKNSLSASETLDLSKVLDMNVNMELLFHTQANTKDKDLNELIEEAKTRFIANDKQVGIEKLWDAFERLKTYFLDITIESSKKKQKDKKRSSQEIVNIISEHFDKEFLNSEFRALSDIGNNYRIRHHEVGKKELTFKHINYFFFRMLSLIDLCLVFLNEEENVVK